VLILGGMTGITGGRGTLKDAIHMTTGTSYTKMRPGQLE
jgi:hypothetical protein